MVKVYVAGPINADNVIDTLKNIRAGIQMGAKLLSIGYSPFVPHMDYILEFVKDITIEQYKAYSMEWLRVSDAVILLPGFEKSEGCKAEIAEAYKLRIPVFGDIQQMRFWFEEGGSC